MSLSTLLPVETHLVGRIVTSSVETTSLTIYAQFEDKKTGDAREPQATTKLFMLSKDSDRAELIFADSHTTSGGITTITVNAAGRGLNKYGALSGSGTGNRHPINSEIGCATSHLPIQEAIEILNGTSGSGFNNLRIGDETGSDVTFYAQNDAANKPYLRYDDANSKWVFSNDGSSSTDVGGGTGSITAGDGIGITAGVVSTDIKADSGLQITATELDLDIRSNFGLVADSNGLYIDLDTDPGLEFNAGKLKTKVKSGGGLTLDSDGLSSVFPQIPVVAGESVDGSSTPELVCVAGENYKARSETSYDWNAIGNTADVGNIDVGAWRAMSFTVPAFTGGTVTIESVWVMIGKTGGPTDQTSITIYDDSASLPNAAIADGVSGNVAGSGLSGTTEQAANEYTFSTDPTVTGGSTYWVVWKRAGILDAVNYYEWKAKAGGGTAATYTASLTSWASLNENLRIDVQYNVNYGGKLFKADANDFHRCNIFGYTESNVVATETATVQDSGHLDYSGLTVAETYYASTTAGAIDADPTVASTMALIPTGKAATTGVLSIRFDGVKRAYGSLGSPRLITGGARTINFTTPIETGFKPISVKLFTAAELGGNADYDGWVETLGSQHAIARTTTDLNSHAVVDAVTDIQAEFEPSIIGEATAYTSVEDIYENGFQLKWHEVNASTFVNNIYWIAYG